MIKTETNFPLTDYNTFGLNVRAKQFVTIQSEEDYLTFRKSGYFDPDTTLIVGCGSNLLFTEDFNGTIIHIDIKGIEHLGEIDDYEIIRAGAGENWDKFVDYCVNNDLGGLENLSLIPGSVGASPIQNIGAYGVEVKDLIEKVEAVDLKTGKIRSFTNRECRFGYRNSIFKRSLKGKYIITWVTFRLTRKHNFTTNYDNIETELDNFTETNLKNIRKAIIKIRTQKLPDFKELGNAGSFFKNPVVSLDKAKALMEFYPKIPIYSLENGKIKLSAAWLIERSNWKGKKIGNVGTYQKQPLVIVNYGGATGEEILGFSEKLQKAVMNQFAVRLEPEVNII